MKVYLIVLIFLLFTDTLSATTTSQISTYTQPYKYLIFTPSCYKALLIDHSLDVQCLKLSLSKMLGYGLVAGGAIVKVPQLIKILLDRSVYGISFVSVFMEALTNWVMIVYSWWRGNPFSIYGENVFLLIQNAAILGLFVIFGRRVPKGTVDPGRSGIQGYLIGWIALLVTLYLTQTPQNWPPSLISNSLLLQIVLFSSARLTQIIHIFKCKSTGSLAFVTCILLFMGNLGRLFTVLVQINEDIMFLASVLLAVVLNGIILVQFVLYWGNRKSNVAQGKKEN